MSDAGRCCSECCTVHDDYTREDDLCADCFKEVRKGNAEMIEAKFTNTGTPRELGDAVKAIVSKFGLADVLAALAEQFYDDMPDAIRSSADELELTQRVSMLSSVANWAARVFKDSPFHNESGTSK